MVNMKYSEGSCRSIIELDVIEKATIIVVVESHAFGIDQYVLRLPGLEPLSLGSRPIS